MKKMRALLFLIFLQLAAAYIESVAANLNLNSRQQTAFVPLVAFKCGYRNKYLSEEGQWKDDSDRYATCMTGKFDILKYCRKVYPKLDVTNIVEYRHENKIVDWCKEEGTPCKWQHTVRPFQCIVGEFRSEALQVPHGCRFGHVDDKKICDGYKHWDATAHAQCSKKDAENHLMTVRSFSVLEPCGLDLFSGVEYVCCPSLADKSKDNSEEKIIDLDGDDDDNEDYDEDEYYSDEEDADEKVEERDPYFRNLDSENEHELYKAALHRLEKKHREKVAKVMREWSELDGRYKTMKKKDPKHAGSFKQEMTDRFQKTVAALEEENKEQKRQTEEVHQERVETLLNEKKREMTRRFRDALANQIDKPDKHQVLKTLKAYIRAEEKDRTHMLNRHRHLLRSDPSEAESTKDILLRRLQDIDLRINGTIAMIRDFPQLEAQIRPIILEFWQQFRAENTPANPDRSAISIGGHEKNERLIQLYHEEFNQARREHSKELHVEIEPILEETEPLIAHELLHHDERAPAFARKDILVDRRLGVVNEMSVSRVSSSHGLLLIGMSATVVLAVVVIVFARRRRNGPNGFVEVDACTPEERHLSGMQVNGYENPTYSFFDRA